MFALGSVASVMYLCVLFYYKLQHLCSFYQYEINFATTILVKIGVYGNIWKTVEQCEVSGN